MTRSAPTSAACRDRGQRGMAMVLVAVIGLLTMSIWMLSYRATHDTIRAERFTNLRQDRDNSSTRALALAIDLCRTGSPPSDGFQCVFAIPDGDDSFFVKATYDKLLDDDLHWSISTSLATDAEILSLPPAPLTF